MARLGRSWPAGAERPRIVRRDLILLVGCTVV